ncbi:MAG TPA: hypothetical protein DCS11_01835 [Syntrophus sp. (in: bacteria)]|nr:hypothetical protein [Syntrophus sp. (in: bacteria)]
MMSASPLTENPGGGGSLSGMLWLSLTLHLALVSVILSLPPLPPAKMTLGPVYSVELVSAPPGLPAPSSDLSPEILRPEAGQPAAVLKNTQALALPERRTEALKRRSEAADAAVEAIRRKVAAQPPAVPAPRVTAETTTPTEGKAGGAERQMHARRYAALVSQLVWSQWAFPRDSLLPAGSEAVVHVTVLANGTVARMDFEKRSGNRYFDESALKAIRKASPFPALPAEIGGGRLEVGIRFHPSRGQ